MERKTSKMKVITAPTIYTPKENEISLFLAGGITNCSNWQNEIIQRIERLRPDDLDNDLIIYNPRRENFPIHQSSAAEEQIRWEFNNLNQMDIFSMYFCAGESDQPICMYELGRYISQMQIRFPTDWNHRIIISVEDGYKRINDVLIQTKLACRHKIRINTQEGYVDIETLRIRHRNSIVNAYRKLKGWS